MIDYGPDMKDDESSIINHQNDDSDFHSPPTPNKKGAFPLSLFLLNKI